MEYLLQFVIASSFIVYAWFYRFVETIIQQGYLNFDYNIYIYLMPIWFGLLNMFSLFLQKQYHLTFRNRFLLITIIGLAVLLPLINTLPLYNYNTTQLLSHNTGVILFYFFVWNVVIAGLEKLLLKKKFTNSDYMWMTLFTVLYITRLV